MFSKCWHNLEDGRIRLGGKSVTIEQLYVPKLSFDRQREYETVVSAIAKDIVP